MCIAMVMVFFENSIPPGISPIVFIECLFNYIRQLIRFWIECPLIYKHRQVIVIRKIIVSMNNVMLRFFKRDLFCHTKKIIWKEDSKCMPANRKRHLRAGLTVRLTAWSSVRRRPLDRGSNLSRDNRFVSLYPVQLHRPPKDCTNTNPDQWKKKQRLLLLCYGHLQFSQLALPCSMALVLRTPGNSSLPFYLSENLRRPG